MHIERIALVISISDNPWASPLAGETMDKSSVPGSERSPGEGNGSPLQSSGLENSIDRRGWWVTAHGLANSQT